MIKHEGQKQVREERACLAYGSRGIDTLAAWRAWQQEGMVVEARSWLITFSLIHRKQREGQTGGVQRETETERQADGQTEQERLKE